MRNINRTSDLRAPSALASARAQANLLRMLGEVRGYLALGDEVFKDNYEAASQAFQADLAELEKARAADSPWMTGLKMDRIFDPLRLQPRFIALMKKVNFQK